MMVVILKQTGITGWLKEMLKMSVRIFNLLDLFHVSRDPNSK